MNIRDLMARIDTLQEYDEPMVEEYIPVQTVHPLLQAMQELREDGVIDEYINKDTIQTDFAVEKKIQNGLNSFN